MTKILTVGSHTLKCITPTVTSHFVKLKELSERIDAIEKRLAIINPEEELQSQFPALQDAYDHYKVIEKLVQDSAK